MRKVVIKVLQALGIMECIFLVIMGVAFVWTLGVTALDRIIPPERSYRRAELELREEYKKYQHEDEQEWFYIGKGEK